MRTAVAVAGVVVGLGAGATSLRAHHAFAAEFDASKPVAFKGKVIKMDWVNPHVWIHVGVTRPDGTVESWAVEGGAPANLFRRGFTKASLQPGTEIVVDGYQAKDGSKRANGREITFPDGRRLFVGSSGTGAPYDKK
jgi:hypothetical protein